MCLAEANIFINAVALMPAILELVIMSCVFDCPSAITETMDWHKVCVSVLSC